MDKWLEVNTIQSYPHNYKEQMFNVSAIERNLGEMIVAVDIDSCYWRTAYKLGYITEKTYIAGLQKSKWKTGRNAAIGSLASTESVTPYNNGFPDRLRQYIVKKNEGHQNIRHHIIDTVYQLFWQLFKEIGDNFLMFLTDCVYAKYDQLRYIENYLRGNAYRFKIHTVEFTELDKRNQKVKWLDYDKDYSNYEGEPISSYSYSSNQAISVNGIPKAGAVCIPSETQSLKAETNNENQQVF